MWEYTRNIGSFVKRVAKPEMLFLRLTKETWMLVSKMIILLKASQVTIRRKISEMSD